MGELNLKFIKTLEEEKDIIGALISTIESYQKETTAFHGELKSRLTELSHIMLGVDNQNGLRGEIKDLKAINARLKERLETLEEWKTKAMAIFVVLQVLMLPLIGTLLKKVFFP